MPPTPPARHERRKAARPSELLDAALDLFVEKGFAATRVEEIAARAGVSKGTLFRYFASKEELFRAVVHESLAARMDAWQAEYGLFQGSTPEMLHYFLQAWWTRVGDTRASGITKLVMTEAHNFPGVARYYHQAVVRPSQALIRRILQRGVDSGEFRPVDLDYAVHSIAGTLLYIVMAKHSMTVFVPAAERLQPQRYIASQLDILLGGLLLPRNLESQPRPDSPVPCPTPPSR